ncbi:MAG: hypothetical protein A2W31_14775 [Planctomycetes bacterium RBG_16_64_10]|nr:MAG: hypothetical protein A2W31_14775 [Planctomycetes bacterium RBG_16_64_10]
MAKSNRSHLRIYHERVDELSRSRTALARREAELAAGIAGAAHSDETVHLAERLLAVLRGGAEGIGCQAAGLYLLDAATTRLKLRTCWGLAPDRLVEPARPLRGAVADLEALTGHAVVLSHPALLDYWHAPEPCAAAVCVPVSTATTLLGTLWMFSDEPREFSDRETNLVEIVAGRLAGELEREMLLSDGMASAELRHQVDAGRRLLESQLPQITPLADPWEVAGWTCQPAGVGGIFHDWFALPDGSVAISVGDAQTRGLEAALVGQAVRSALRAHAAHDSDPGRTLDRVSQDLWSGSPGDQFAAAMYAVLSPHSGQLRLATAGNIRAGVLQRDGWQGLTTSAIPLGVQSDRGYEARQATLRSGAALIILTDGIPTPAGTAGMGADLTALADALKPHYGTSAARLLGAIRNLAEGAAPVDAGHGGWAVMVITRR